MKRIKLIHWNLKEAEERVKFLKKAGYTVDYKMIDQVELKNIRKAPPLAVIIDLSRLPSHGREVGLALRIFKTTRLVPLIFIGGKPEKIKGIKKLLPDVIFTNWAKIHSDLKKAIKNPPINPVVPKSSMESYTTVPLLRKLGIKENTIVALLNAPINFEKILGKLPDGVKLKKGFSGISELFIWFIKSRKELDSNIKKISLKLGKSSLWVAWPKQASGLKTDLTQQYVRETGLSAGLVDYKICSIDDTWSGLKFSVRKK